MYFPKINFGLWNSCWFQIHKKWLKIIYVLEHTFDDGIENEHPWFQIGWEQIGKYSKQTSFYKLLNADLEVNSFNVYIKHLVYQKEAQLHHPFHEIQHFDMIRWAELTDLYGWIQYKHR